MTEPAIPQKSPYVMDMKPGEYWWCACGFSKKQPFCDGSHQASGTGKQPLKVVVDQPKKIAWCGCKRSGTPPQCNGAHTQLR